MDERAQADPAAEDAAAARRAALAARLRFLARCAQAIGFVLGLYVAARAVRRGGTIGAAEKTELVLGGVAMIVALAGLLKGLRRGAANR